MDSKSVLVFDTFIGWWDFERTIMDYTSGSQIKANGSVEFTKLSDNRLMYHERGTLLLGNKEISFSRKYYYCLEPNHISIYFADGVNYGQLFQALVVDFEQSPAMAQAEHLCINDMYRGTFLFYNGGRFKNTFRIKGPNKDQLIDSTFTKRYTEKIN